MGRGGVTYIPRYLPRHCHFRLHDRYSIVYMFYIGHSQSINIRSFFVSLTPEKVLLSFRGTLLLCQSVLTGELATEETLLLDCRLPISNELSSVMKGFDR